MFLTIGGLDLDKGALAIAKKGLPYRMPKTVHQLLKDKARKWRTLNGAKLLPEVIAGVQFVDEEKPEKNAA